MLFGIAEYFPEMFLTWGDNLEFLIRILLAAFHQEASRHHRAEQDLPQRGQHGFEADGSLPQAHHQ